MGPLFNEGTLFVKVHYKARTIAIGVIIRSQTVVMESLRELKLDTYGRSLAQMCRVSICDLDHTGRRPTAVDERKRVQPNRMAGTFDPKSTTSNSDHRWVAIQVGRRIRFGSTRLELMQL